MRLRLKSKTRQLLKMKNFSQFFYKVWFLDLTFMVYLLRHMNEQITKLMGKDTFAHEMYSSSIINVKTIFSQSQ